MKSPLINSKVKGFIYPTNDNTDTNDTRSQNIKEVKKDISVFILIGYFVYIVCLVIFLIINLWLYNV